MASDALLRNMDSSDDCGPHQQRVNTSDGAFRKKKKKKTFVSVTLISQFQKVIAEMI